jgi:hypothetical protein
MEVWEDHLLLLLPREAAARLACTCKALKEVVRERFTGDAWEYEIGLGELQAALTTFPRLRTLEVCSGRFKLSQARPLADWLRTGGHGRGIKTIAAGSGDDLLNDLIHTALREGALPSLESVSANLYQERHRALLTGGLLGAMHELRLEIYGSEWKPQFAALGLVRHLPALTTLKLRTRLVYAYDEDLMPWPPLIPSSLKALSVDSEDHHMSRAFLCALPGMLHASGARLDRLEVLLTSYKSPRRASLYGGLVNVAQALRCCSPTLKGLVLNHARPRDIDDRAQVEQLQVQWVDVLASVAACRELKILVLPEVGVEPLFRPGTAFGHLTHLDLHDHERKHPPDAGVMGLWELMASGALPVLAELRLSSGGRWGGLEDVRSRVVPAFEAVAGTLTQLDMGYYRALSDEEELGYEWGLAVGKLRRLKDLALGLFSGGRAYRAFAQGLAASGGGCPLPLLWRLILKSDVQADPDLLASLLLPRVRVFGSYHTDRRAALLMACALRQAGYKHTWAVDCPRTYDLTYLLEAPDAVIKAIAQCMVREGISFWRDIWGVLHSWRNHLTG